TRRSSDLVLLLLDLDLSRAADADDRDAAGELRQPLLQLLLVIVGGRVLDLRLDLSDPRLDLLFLAAAVDDGGVFFLDSHPLGPAKHLQRDVLELDAEILSDHRARGQDGDILEHRLTAIAKAWRLDRRNLKAATQLVDDQGRERLALDVLGDDEQRFASLYNRL